MSWVIAKQGRMYPVSIYQRDCFAVSFSDNTYKMMYAPRQLQSIIPPKMTAMMQLTDTDFSYVFKGLMRKSVDKIVAKGQQAMGTSDVYQMGERNENIENLLKIIEKTQKTLKKHTPPGRRTLFVFVFELFCSLAMATGLWLSSEHLTRSRSRW